MSDDALREHRCRPRAQHAPPAASATSVVARHRAVELDARRGALRADRDDEHLAEDAAAALALALAVSAVPLPPVGALVVAAAAAPGARTARSTDRRALLAAVAARRDDEAAPQRARDRGGLGGGRRRHELAHELILGTQPRGGAAARARAPRARVARPATAAASEPR